MNLPPFLLGLAVLLWGWHSSIWILLLFAIPLAVILEARHFVQWRWQVSGDHLRRMVNFCWRMTAVGLLYLLVVQSSFGLIYVFLQYLPAAFASLVILQAYGILETIQMRDLFPRVPLFRSKRSKSRQSPAFALSSSDPWARPLPFVHVQVGYVLLCLVAASAASRQDPNFYFCMAGLSLWMLWAKRSRCVKPVVWLGLIVLTVGLGFGGHVGLHQLQGKVDQQASQWLHQSGQEADPFQSHTQLGSLGELKQSNQIFFRVNAANPKLFPLLLRDASYNLYRSSTWIAQQPQFRSVDMQQDGRTWQLGHRTQVAQSAPLPNLTITTDLRNGRGLLSLPDGSQQLQQLPVDQVERNQYGAVKVAGPAGTVAYQVTFDPQHTWDSPPSPADLEIPEPEQPAIAQVVRQLQLEGKPPQEVMERLSAFFQNQFHYSLKLSAPAGGMTPLTAFLLQNRSGHCEYFASATVLLLRQVGIPARYATGYSVHEYSNLEGQYVVRGRNAHAWTMVYVQDHWQALDTTPTAWVEMEDRAAPFWQRCLDAWSWFTLQLATGLGHLAKSNLVLLGLGTLLLGMVLLGLKSLWRRKHLVPAKPVQPKLAPAGHDSEFYRIEQALAQWGCQRQADEPLQRWLQRLETHLPARQFAALQAILDLHYRYRFDPEGLTSAERDQLKTLSRDWLREQAIAPKVG
jgi:protein-glutamine gamma-glutamyltransferase